jgi:hypothetical protein
MRSKKIFSFDEKRDAEQILTAGFPNNTIDYNKMYLIAKYFRENQRYGAIRLERELIRFCKQYDKNFNPVTEADTIKKWVNSAMNYGLRKIDSVIISQKEIDTLKEIELQKDKKLLFITLVFSKALKGKSTKRKHKKLKSSDNYYIHFSNFLDIIRLSKLSNISEIELAKIFYKYKNMLFLYKPKKELIRLEYADKNPETRIIIDNFEKLIDYYNILFEKEKKINVCARCRNPIIKKNNYQKYCSTCSKEVIREKKRMLMRERRK